ALQDVVYSSHGKYNVKLNGKLNVPGDFNSAYGLISHPDFNFSQAQSGFDINGDGRSDLVLYRSSKACVITNDPRDCTDYQTDGNWKVYLSNGRKLEFSQTLFSSKNSLSHMKFADFNGDGLSDLLYAGTNNKWYIKLSNGKSFLPSISTGITQSDPNKVKVLDYDLDNQADIAYFSSGWKSKYLTAYRTVTSGDTILSSSDYTEDTENNNPQLADLNGDGQLEFLLNKNKNWFVFQRDFTTGTAPDVITDYISGHGLSTKIHYKSGKNEEVYSRGQEVSFPVLNITPNGQLVSQVDSDDGLDGILSVKYRYAGLRAHTQGHGMLGYSSMSTIDENNDDGLSFITTTYYNQGFDNDNVSGDVIDVGELDDWRYIGMPLNTTTKASDGTSTTLLKTAINHVFTHKKSTPASNSGSLVDPHLAYISRSIDTSYTLNTAWNVLDGNLSSVALQTTTNDFDYDHYGNVTRSVFSINDNLSAEFFTTTTENYYQANDAGTYCASNVSQGSFADYEKYGRLTCTIVTKSRTGVSDVVKKSAFGYNSNGILVDEETSPGTDLALLKSKTFNAHGHIKTNTISAKNYNPENGTYQQATDKVTTYSYHGIDARFPSKVSNSEGHSKYFTYNSLYAQKKTEAVNGVKNTFFYDDFGRPIGSKSGITNQYTNINYLLCTNNAICDVPIAQLGVNILYAVQKLANGSPETVEYFDIMGRKVASRKESFTSGTYIYTGTQYDAKGHVVRTYSPSNFAPIKDYGSQFFYDVLDRPVREISTFDNVNMENGVNSSTTFISYTNRKTSSINALSQTKVEHKNAVGEVVSIDDFSANDAITYQYYADGKLHKTTDIHNNTVVLSYDIAGNKTQTIDPDMGTWHYQYNGFGQLVWQKDAESQQSWHFFDALGRKSLRIDNATGSGATVQSSCWLYDANHHGSLDRTRLVSGKKTLSQCRTQSAFIEDKTFAYDSKKRPTSTYSQIKSLKEGEVSYYSRVYYNNVGKVGLKQSSFDEGFVYQYGVNGYKDKTYQATTNKLLHDIVSVNEQGLVTSEKSYPLSGTIHQTRHYNAANGTLASTMTSGAWGTISAQRFTFDRLGNLKERVNQFDYNNDGLLDNNTEKYAENFTYDGMNRIAQHKINNSNYQYFCYDALGNITHKKTGALQCNSTASHRYANKPHQVSHYGGVSYSYNDNGSVIRNGDRTIEYSAFGKANKIIKSPVVVQFQYGVNRSRFERVDTDNNGFIVTHYHGGVEHIYENNKHEKKFYEGNLLITKKDGQYAYKGLIKDHLNSVVAIVDELTFLETHYRYDAFGKQYTVTSKQAASAIKVAGRTYNTQRGFTGHEMLASVDIIHMNG
ncbi:MAG: FG-GAP-like repeat-containing protein, partial [Litorilituus sp.]|nr:FG-GAP-like repeat-containing protein [Litorilituus sp.]